MKEVDYERFSKEALIHLVMHQVLEKLQDVIDDFEYTNRKD